MARSRSLTLTLTVGVGRSVTPWCRMVNRREQSSTSDPLIHKLEDAIRCIMVRRSAPDWLPFLPGASYWVPPPPPQPSNVLAQLLHDLANPNSNSNSNSIHPHLPSWPSSSYFIQGAAAPLLPGPGPDSQDDEELD